MYKTILYLASLLTVMFVYADSVRATYITINTSSSLTTNISEQYLLINGYYDIENKGDEIARNLFPVFYLGKWEWAAEAVSLSPNHKNRWELSFKIALDDVFPLTSFEDAPLGQLPLFIRKHYEDVNAYSFSAVEVIILSYGAGLTPEILGQIRVPRIKNDLICSNKGQQSSCVLAAKNLTSADMALQATVFTSQELQPSRLSLDMHIPGNGQQSKVIEVKNINGITGSSYAVFAVTTWVQDGRRYAVPVSTTVKIMKDSIAGKLQWFGIASIVIVGLYIVRSRKGRRSLSNSA